eukprot:TRINITY_DN11831_c0_g1_i1.p1 TRINITY_DN11831_c0_g1~~TRINITY_DN11831_c0_g1_i1.p1  ORF type:complete len:161 (-),score=28.44 TRINITY_DN11831_c0_g1_i1:15-497(-)
MFPSLMFLHRTGLLSNGNLLARAELKRAQNGLYAKKTMKHGHQVSYSMKKTNRVWRPNIHWKTFHSDLLNQKFQVKVSTKALRWIDKVGGIDNYVLFTKEEDLDSQIGEELRTHLIKAWEKKNNTKFQRSQILHQKKVEQWREEENYHEKCRKEWIQNNL